MQANLASFQDLQYCKTDLIATKGVVFCKYAKSSSALAALEAITDTGMVSPGTPVFAVYSMYLLTTPKYIHAFAQFLQLYIPQSISLYGMKTCKRLLSLWVLCIAEGR